MRRLVPRRAVALRLTPEEAASNGGGFIAAKRDCGRDPVGDFAPVPNLGLICVDEEHDQSLQAGRDAALQRADVAVMRAKLVGAVVVLGSATPCLRAGRTRCRESTHDAIEERVMNRPLPEVELIDMRREFQETGKEQLFSRSLVAETHAALSVASRRYSAESARVFVPVICRALERSWSA